MRRVSFSTRERRLGWSAGLAVGTWACLTWAVQPIWDRVGELRLHVETQMERMAALGGLLERALVIEDAYERLADYVTVAHPEEAQRALLSDLEQLSRSIGLRMNLKPRAFSQAEEDLGRVEVEVDIEGSQDQLLYFVDSVLRLPKLIGIEQVRIASVPGQEESLRGNLIIQQLVPTPEPI